jgi:hypothetical protein
VYKWILVDSVHIYFFVAKLNSYQEMHFWEAKEFAAKAALSSSKDQPPAHCPMKLVLILVLFLGLVGVLASAGAFPCCHATCDKLFSTTSNWAKHEVKLHECVVGCSYCAVCPCILSLSLSCGCLLKAMGCMRGAGTTIM